MMIGRPFSVPVAPQRGLQCAEYVVVHAPCKVHCTIREFSVVPRLELHSRFVPPTDVTRIELNKICPAGGGDNAMVIK